ncbi:myo-inositol 2-dehydrogenase/D-chiro-inositol 1-dehydrogenase [Spinactinospora alkalitolerans]|uniref:Myo-inositol 2-dehydrogenase/D-chiro-inositol 1-dehydrogenase n=1 Tax=Spinactinospora alkalitolerans TaxID=687207 RepID=A0A852TMP5_9ACTN|nr:Gfo/Idh/MocA family oxidoreductase [Spinactinospora alkalitolerans]NYE45219.1 myo-inositol 2-dehydrogenase/D-chiro-inositol 1-dehydrogenase [Spinactinospora alkalitolerans]
MRIGLIGTGRIGASHAAAVAARPEVTELVLADADADRVRSVAAGLGAAVASADELTAPGAVDGLVVTAATTAHPGLITAGVRAGIPVFCEKPVAPDVAGTVEVLAEVERSGVPVHIGFQRRFDAGYARARAALLDGELGELHRVHVITADPEPPHPSYIPASGGIFRDCHVHDFDVLRWVTGREVVEVHALGSNRGAAFFAEAGDVDNSAAVLRLDDGTLVTLQGSRYNGAGYDVRMELAGSLGTIAVGLDEHAPLTSAETGVDFPAGAAWPNFWARFTPAYHAEIVAFLDMVKGSGESPCTVADALEAVLIAEAADRSMREGRPVRPADLRPGR